MWKKCWRAGVGCMLAFLIICLAPYAVAAGNGREEGGDIYDALRNSIQENWANGFEQLEAPDHIEIKGSWPERILRCLADLFYRHLVSIKAWSLLIGLLSFITGVFTAATAKLNKRLRRSAILLLVVTVPALLIVFTYGISLLVGMFK